MASTICANRSYFGLGFRIRLGLGGFRDLISVSLKGMNRGGGQPGVVAVMGGDGATNRLVEDVPCSVGCAGR